MGIGDRIKEVRLQKNKTLLDIANHLGVTEATVQRYESGNIKNLKLDTITRIATYLNVNPGYLMGWNDFTENTKLETDYDYFPTSVSAGLPTDVDVIMESNVEKIKIPDLVMGKWSKHDDVYITKVNGNSMDNVIPDGSLIAVKPSEINELKDGDIVVYSCNHEYGVKRFYQFDDKVIFKPDSSDVRFTDHEVNLNEIEVLNIHGKVVVYIVELD